MTLIHLVSEQPMPNLLPLLALRPARVVQVMSNKPVYREIAGNIRYAYQHALSQRQGGDQETCEFVDPVVIPNGSPSIQQTKKLVQQLMRRYDENGETCCLNFTGATKLMSIGAYLAAKGKKVPSFYCDTFAQKVVQGKTASDSEPTFDLLSLFRDLDVETILAAHGKVRGRDWEAYTPSEEEIAFGTEAYNLKQRYPGAFRNYFNQVRRWALQGKRNPNGADVRRTLECPMPTTDFGPLHHYLRQAVAVGYLKEHHGELYFRFPKRSLRNNRAKKDRINRVLSCLDGVGFEYYVLATLRQSEPYIDTLNSIHPLKDAVEDYGETDIACIDTQRLGLTVISCKSSPQGASLEHFEALLRRKSLLGGLAARAMLCIAQVEDDHAANRIHERGNALGVQVLIGDAIKRHFLRENKEGQASDTRKKRRRRRKPNKQARAKRQRHAKSEIPA